MERESFEDDAIAALMNEHFVCVKVDREERPDVDALYMEAVQTMTGHGGWPLNVFLTPEQVPFYGGTYFPPAAAPRDAGLAGRARGGRRGVGHPARGDPARRATRWRRGCPATARAAAGRAAPLNAAILDDAVAQPARGVRPRSRRLRAARRSSPPPRRCESALPCGRGETGQMAVYTLRAMAAGGIYDQVGGGFARYAVDAPGRSRTSRRCSTTTRCWRAPTCTAGR